LTQTQPVQLSQAVRNTHWLFKKRRKPKWRPKRYRSALSNFGKTFAANGHKLPKKQ
jgi:hypothetical protein